MVKAAFSNMTALSRVSLKAIPWQCTCNNLWFVEDFKRDGIEFESEVVCDTPGQWTGIRGTDYIASVCEEPQCDTGSLPSVDFGVVCVTYLQMFIYCLAFLSVLLFPPALYLCIKTRRLAAKQSGGSGIRMMTPRKPPPRQRAPLGHHTSKNKQWLYGSHPADSHA
ncbi:hypothetical protein EGW08_009070 [Elysia chlorotica]|uniref:LRRCT domain-containing protein n=1 Tax=Elysia chlorotica TaxID=188477 RepID=A0A433TNQ6_ELYCH|nr:hypothetical protein EGW08_009070 [Elysia chlorotica]